MTLVSRETLIVWMVLFAGVVIGVVTDTVDWPVDNWLTVETTYVAAVGLVAGMASEIHRWRDEAISQRNSTLPG